MSFNLEKGVLMATNDHVAAKSQGLAEVAVRFDPKSSADAPSSSGAPIVGIGASAGGLDALERFFEAMPSDSGCTFVVVQHLAPQYPTHMDGILQRKTKMPVKIAAHGGRLEPNTVYVGPPGYVVEIDNDVIVLRDSDRSAVPISTISALFRSLAQSVGRRSIAVILSGTGSDGTDSLADVRRAGGTIIIQDSVTAEFSGMPKSAIALGIFDYILSPSQMPETICSIAGDETIPASSDCSDLVDESKYQEILDLLEATYDVDFARYKQSTIIRRIQRRLELDHAQSLVEYHHRLADDPEELDHLYCDLLIGVTQFFRDPHQFALLETRCLPELIENCKEKGEIRVWVTACASGEEAYSIAMLIDEQLTNMDSPPNVRFFATDLHPGAIKSAARGLYKPDAISEMSEARLRRYFVRDGENYRIVPWLRQRILFSQHNLLRDPPFTQMDLVTCRNLLIYFDQDAQDSAIARMHFSLRKDGMIFLGHGERIGRHGDEFEPIAPNVRLYRKKRDVKLVKIDGTKLPGMSAAVRPRQAAKRPLSAAMLKAYDVLLTRLSYNGFLITERGEIEHTFGEAGQLLNMAGAARLNLFELVPKDLRAAVQTTVLRAKSSESTQMSGTIDIQFPGEESKRLKIQVEPMPALSYEERLYLVRLTSIVPHPEKEEVDAFSSEGERSEVAWLRSELAVAQDGLERLMQELGARNEELQSSNEELTSSNEELQSTNEELQSVNEELHTINNEHQRTITDLQVLTHDMETTLIGINVAVLFVNVDSTIRSLTAKAKKFFVLSDNDINRSIEEIGSRLGFADLEAKITKTSEDKAPAEYVVQNHQGDRFSMRILPKEGFQGEPLGHILTFTKAA